LEASFCLVTVTLLPPCYCAIIIQQYIFGG
jgi:hypothetical protein